MISGGNRYPRSLGDGLVIGLLCQLRPQLDNAFKELLGCFSCDAWESWVHVTPRGNPESLRYACNAVNLNLKPKAN